MCVYKLAIKHLKQIICLISYRSEGEKVRVGDDLILVSVATERYLVSSLFCQSDLLKIVFKLSADFFDFWLIRKQA